MSDAIDLRERSGRVDLFDWGLLDRDLNRIGTLHPLTSSEPAMQWSIGGEAGRVLRGLQVPADEVVDLNPAADRIQPLWVDPVTGTPEPCGVFCFAGETTVTKFSGGDLVESTISDLSGWLDVAIDRNLSWPSGAKVAAAADRLAGLVGLPAVEIDPTSAELAEPLTFLRGDTTWLRVADALAKAGGMLTPYFTRAGVWRWRVAPVWEAAAPDFEYRQDGSRGLVALRSFQATVSLLNQPNTFYAQNGSAADAPVVGRYTLPDAAPNSIARTGREVPEMVDVSGLLEGETASDAARAAAAQSLEESGPAALSTPFDPRHELFDLFLVDDIRYRSISGSVGLVAGQLTRHTLRRVWTTQDPAGTLLQGLLP